MAASRSVATSPYAVVWLGGIHPLQGQTGVLSVHKRLDLAVRAAMRQRDALRGFSNTYGLWFHYQVIDRRDGAVVQFVRG